MRRQRNDADRVDAGQISKQVPIHGADAIFDRLDRIESLINRLLDAPISKAHYGVEEFSELVKRAPFTVRQWCNNGRIHAEKSMTQSGCTSRWVISHGEYQRFSEKGLLPLLSRGNL